MSNLVNELSTNKNQTASNSKTLSDKSFVTNFIGLASGRVNTYDMPMVVEAQSLVGDTMIWGHASFGIWGINKWGSSGSLGSFEISRIINANSIYNFFGSSKEESLLLDSSSDATINNSTGVISFTAGQKLVGRAHYDPSSNPITQATYTFDLSIFDDSDNYSFELSANGKTDWVTVSVSSIAVFSASQKGKDLYYRITNTSGSAAEITIKDPVLGGRKPIQVTYILES